MSCVVMSDRGCSLKLDSIWIIILLLVLVIGCGNTQPKNTSDDGD